MRGDDGYEGLDLNFREVLVDGVCFDQLSDALEQAVDEVRIRVLCLLKQLEDAVQELSKEFLEGRETQTDDLCEDVERGNDHWAVISLERVEDQLNERIQPGDHLLLLLFSIGLEVKRDHLLILERLLQTLKPEAREDSA